MNLFSLLVSSSEIWFFPFPPPVASFLILFLLICPPSSSSRCLSLEKIDNMKISLHVFCLKTRNSLIDVIIAINLPRMRLHGCLNLLSSLFRKSANRTVKIAASWLVVPLFNVDFCSLSLLLALRFYHDFVSLR